ncbi:hypothetical protein [Nostoc sp. NZL]|uniref:hypothetical protein n=1 Tax=Nostoc sp. NZL TaxID=2650612 RepID=UPI0018C47F50|nr:hypothetical protein [Nostoc sp. NZL]
MLSDIIILSNSPSQGYGVHTSRPRASFQAKKVDFSCSHAEHGNGLLGAAASSQTLSQRLNECIPSLRLGTSQALSS